MMFRRLLPLQCRDTTRAEAKEAYSRDLKIEISESRRNEQNFSNQLIQFSILFRD